MWKESYRIGIDRIDNQHIELFRMTAELVNAIENGAETGVFQKAIDFLKRYVVYHFKDEEEYQASVCYDGLEAHKKMHRDFTDTVLVYEKRLLYSNFDIRIIKQMAGMLTSWLIFHVADADQKIAVKQINPASLTQQSCIQNIADSSVYVLEKMAGLDRACITQKAVARSQIQASVLVEIGLIGDLNGRTYFGFSKELALRLIEIMMFTTPTAIDELVCSALAEISNIASGTAITSLADHGSLCDITTPVVSVDSVKAGIFDTIFIDTGAGQLTVSVQLD